LIARGFQPRRPIFSKLCRPERSGITSVANDSAKSRRSGLIEEQKTEAVTRITDGHVPDQVYEEVRPHFTDKELADLALAVATINAWNRLAIASRTEPGSYQPAKVHEVKKGGLKCGAGTREKCRVRRTLLSDVLTL